MSARLDLPWPIRVAYPRWFLDRYGDDLVLTWSESPARSLDRAAGRRRVVGPQSRRRRREWPEAATRLVAAGPRPGAGWQVEPPGGDVSGLALRSSYAGSPAGVCSRGGAHARPRYRSQRGDLQCRRCGTAGGSAVSRPAEPLPGVGRTSFQPRAVPEARRPNCRGPGTVRLQLDRAHADAAVGRGGRGARSESDGRSFSSFRDASVARSPICRR